MSLAWKGSPELVQLPAYWVAICPRLLSRATSSFYASARVLLLKAAAS